MRIVLLSLLCTNLLAGPVVAAPNGGWNAVWSSDGSKVAFAAANPHGVTDVWVAADNGSSPSRISHSGGRAPAWVGESVIFVTLRTGKPRMMRAAPGKEPAPLALPAEAAEPAWSPDGMSVAYVVVGASGRSRDLWIAGADGSAAKAITNQLWIREFTWSPDGTRIACVVGRTAGTSIWMVQVQEIEANMLYKGFSSTTAFSPDGKTLAFAAPFLMGSRKIVLLDIASGSEEKRIATHGFDGRSLDWSRDGRRLVFASGGSDSSVWTVGRDGRSLRRVTPENLYAIEPRYSPTDDRILFSAASEQSYGPDVYTVSVDGSNLKRLTRTVPSQWQPVWSPDGSRIAYLTDEGNVGKLNVRSVTSRSQRTVFEFDPGSSVTLHWTPDGKQIIFSQDGLVHQLQPDKMNKDARPALNAAGQAQPFPGQDGKIFFINWNSGQGGISCLSPGDKEPVELTSGTEKEAQIGRDDIELAPEDPHRGLEAAGPDRQQMPRQTINVPVPDLYPSVSPDGSTVAFVRDEQIWLVSTAGRNLRQVTDIQNPRDGKRVIMWPSWSPDSSKLLFVAHVEQQGILLTEIWTIELPAGDEKRVWSERIDSEYGLLYAEQAWYPPVFTHDGLGIMFTSSSAADSRPTVIDLNGRNPIILVDEPAVFPTLSPDGKRLAYTSFAGGRQTIKIIEVKE